VDSICTAASAVTEATPGVARNAAAAPAGSCATTALMMGIRRPTRIPWLVIDPATAANLPGAARTIYEPAGLAEATAGRDPDAAEAAVGESSPATATIATPVAATTARHLAAPPRQLCPRRRNLPDVPEFIPVFYLSPTHGPPGDRPRTAPGLVHQVEPLDPSGGLRASA
jgi:hypothetical protein